MANKGIFLGVATILTTGGVLAAIVLNAGKSETQSPPTIATQATETVETDPLEPAPAQNDFQSMKVDTNFPECRVPTPPSALARSAYIRNGYAAIRKIMAMQSWQETGSCECFSDQITWQDTITESEKYITSDNPLLPFDVVALQKIGDETEAARREVCEN